MKGLFKPKSHGESNELPEPSGRVQINQMSESLPQVRATRVENLPSQGLIQSSFESCAMMHASSRSVALLRALMMPNDALVLPNTTSTSMVRSMHRESTWTVAALGLACTPPPSALSISRLLRDGSNFGCVADGITAGGKVNAYAAQLISNYILCWLAEYHPSLSEDTIRLKVQLEKLFQLASHFKNNMPRSFNAEGGSTTLAFATFKPIPLEAKSCLMIAGSIGDSACIVLHPQHGARMVTRLNRVSRDQMDTGGQITMSMGVHGEACPHVHRVPLDCHIILSTDGLTDNIHKQEIQQIIPLIVSSPFFQKTPETTQFFAELPNYEQLFMLVKEHGRDRLVTVSCADAAIRLTNYLSWVTHGLRETEQSFFGLSNKMKLEHMKPKPDLELIAEYEKRLEKLRAANAKGKPAGKTDDAIVLVMRPFHSRPRP